MSLIKRVKYLEDRLNVEDDAGAEAVIIFSEDQSANASPPQPVTKFTVMGHTIQRDKTETYQDFEDRAVREAFSFLPPRRSGCPMPTPCLIANGSQQGQLKKRNKK